MENKMRTQSKPLILIFAIAVFLLMMLVVSLTKNVYGYGFKAFTMTPLKSYLYLAVFLLFIHLYINKHFSAWYIALIPMLDLLRYVMFAKTPSDPYMSEWHYRIFGIVVFALLLCYMLSNYKAYQIYTNKGDITKLEGIPDDNSDISNLGNISQNPLFNVFAIAKMVLVLDILSLACKPFSTENNFDIFYSVCFLVITVAFISSYKADRRFTCDIAIVAVLSGLIYFLLYKGDENDNLIALHTMKIIFTLLNLLIVYYLLKKRKQYHNYIKNKLSKNLV